MTGLILMEITDQSVGDKQMVKMYGLKFASETVRSVSYFHGPGEGI